MRAQISQEVMFIYGMVLISVTLILLSFYYFDIGDLKLLRRVDTCTFGPLFTCEDFTYDKETQNLTIQLRNGMEASIYNLTLEVKQPCKGVTWRSGEDAILGLKSLETANYQINCPLQEGTHEVLMEANFTTAQSQDIQRHRQGQLRVKVR